MYVIKYTDGAFNMNSGRPVILKEATRYNTYAAAEIAMKYLIDVEGIFEIVDDQDDPWETW